MIIIESLNTKELYCTWRYSKIENEQIISKQMERDHHKKNQRYASKVGFLSLSLVISPRFTCSS